MDLTRQLDAPEVGMNTMNESCNKGWKFLGTKMGKDNARLYRMMNFNLGYAYEETVKLLLDFNDISYSLELES
ncbi:MAG: hypothetical protein OXC82_04105 [Rhodobacteraceae bacterium]|nr:hypothetical protein [Paracoccaceae bacterium]MCY4249605.1 hypothetical protein [Paracoccaceae bacterium]